MHTKKILVLGGSGHLGSNLIHHLVDDKGCRPENIRVFYRAGTPTNAVDDIEGLNFFAGDVLNEADVHQAFEGMQIVFHLIGSTTFNPLIKKQQWQINVHGTKHILEAALKSSTFEKMCYVSTVNVLAPQHPTGAAADIDACNPYTSPNKIHSFASPVQALQFISTTENATNDKWVKAIDIGYYDSKLAAQELVNYYVQHHQLNVVSVLPGTMFGAYDFLIGSGVYITTLYSQGIPVALKTGFPLTHVMDVAEGMVQSIEHFQRGEHFILSGKPEDNRSLKDMLHIIAEELQTFFPNKKFVTPKIELPNAVVYAAAWLYERIAGLFGLPLTINTQAVKAGKYYWYFLHEKSTKAIGYTAKCTFRAGVRDAINYYIQHNLIHVSERQADKA
ncbi:MAG: NAD-dependent epimerase/dehydratase family protein [Chitinophagales bacterium]